MTTEREGRCDEAVIADDSLPPEVSGSRAAYERYLKEAAAVEGPLHGPRVNLGVAYHNAVAGAEAVMSEKARLERELPLIDSKWVASLPELVLAVIYASNLIDRAAPKPTMAMISQATELRAKLLPAAEVLATAGLFPEREVARIRTGKGHIDTADDLVALARLFTDHAKAIQGKTPITASEVREASDLGTELRTVLRPRGARKAPMDPELAQAIETRDRLWTLLSERYDLVRRAGAWLFGLDNVTEMVPALGSRTRAKARAVTEIVAKEA